MLKFLSRLLLIAALCVPWVTQAQCNGTECTISIMGTDSYGDGWNDASIAVYQGTTLRGTFTLTDGSSGSGTVVVCTDDSVRFQWNSGSYDDEAYFTILNGDGTVIISNANGYNYENGDVIAVVEVVCPSCIAPTAFAVVATGDTANFTWTDATGSSWELVYGQTGFNPDNATNVLYPTTTSYELTGIDDGQYEAYVRTDCGSDDYSVWVGPVNFNVGNVILNMATSGSDTLRSCNAIVYDDGGPTGAYSASISSSILVIYPSDNQHAVSISGQSYTESTYDYLRIYQGVGTNGEELWNDYGVSATQTFGPFLSTDAITVAFHSDGSVQYAGFQINVTCVDMPNCITPETFTVDNVDSSSVEFLWTDNSASAWAIAYGPAGFTMGDANTQWENFATTSGTITGLNPNTLYDFYLMALCGGDTSWTRSLTVRTACGDITQLPVTYNFDDQATGSSADFAYCWTRYNSTATYMYYPYIYSGSSYAHSGNNCLYTYLYTSDDYPDTILTILPPIDSTVYQVENLEVLFWAATSSSSYHPIFEVGVYVDNSDTTYFLPYDTISVLYSNGLAEYSIIFTGYEGPQGRIAFRFLKSMMCATYSYCYLYMDDVTIREANDCIIPENFTVNAANADSIMVTWQEMGEATAWELVYGPAGFDPDTVTDGMIQATDTVYYIENIPSGITYHAYVRAVCGDGNSYWAGPVAFTPGSINMGVTGSATMYVCNAVIFDDGGATGQYSNSCDYTLTLYPNDDTKRFKFWASGSTESCCDYLRIYAGAAAAGTPLGTIQGDNLTIDTVLTQGGPITIYFHSDGSVLRDGFEIHVMCDDLPSCRDIENVTVEEVSTSSVYVTWENVLGNTPLPSSYIVTVYDSASSAVSTVTTSDMFAVVGGLTAGTGYTVSVVPSCDDANGNASGTTFTTANFACLQVDPTTSHFDSIGTGTSTSSYFPVYTCYNYCLTQQIYTASEFNGGGSLTGIAFMPQSVAAPNGTNRTIEIYVGHVSSATASSFVYPPDLTMVYSGTQTFVADQWSNITFDNAFNYNGTDNLLVMFRDMTGVYSCSNYWYVHTASSGSSCYVYQDSGPYTVGSTSGGTTSSDRMNAIFSFLDCSQEATCAAPLMVVSNITDQSVDLLWAAGASETSWTVQHRAEGDASWTTDLSSTSATTYTVTGLQTNTLYEFRVFHMCGTDTFATVRTARTACVGQSVPFYENFSTWTTGSSAPVPSCWFKGSNYSSGYPYVTTSYSMGDGKSMYFYASGTTLTYLALPQIAAPLDTLLVSGNIYYSSNGYSLQIGYMTDPEDGNTFHAVSSVSSVADTWVPFEVGFSGVTNGNIAFTVGNNGSYDYVYLDNIEVNYINPCIRPTNVNTTNITQTSADVSWSDTATNNFIVEYGPAGFAHGNGTTLTVTGNTVQLSGLVHSTVYDVYVRGICGTGDSSNWSFTRQFATSCGTIDALPITETFNNWGSGSSVHAPNCWGYGSTYSTSYPYINSSYNHSGSGGAMYMYNYSTNYTYFSLPEFDSSMFSASDLQVYFYAYNPTSTSTYVADVIVGVCNTPGNMNTFVGVDTITLVYEGANAWRPYEVALDSYTGNGRYITFVAMPSAGSTYCYPVIDDVTLELIPTCQRPNELSASNATSNSVDLAWNDRANASQWQIEYGPVGFELGTGTTVIANSNPFTLNNLPNSYQGEFYVRAICSATDSGDYSRDGCVFNTSQIPATLPYNYDFENAAEWANWQTSSNSEVYDWHRGTNVADNGGSYSMYVASSDSTYYSYAFNAVVNAAAYRDIDFGPVDSSYTLSFRARAGGTTTNTYDGLMVFLVDPSLSTVPSNSNITSPWGNVNDLYRIATMRLDTTWQTYTASFDTIHGIHRVAFFWFNQNTGASYANIPQPAAVDNITIDYSSCPRPVNLTAATGPNSATISWQGAANANYQVVYRAVNNGTNQFLNTPTNSITLTGLESITDYVCWVRKVCGANDTSLWSDNIVFTTDLCDGAVNAYNYDPTTASTTSSYSPIGYATYNYSYVQTIIDSAWLAGMEGAEITAFTYTPTDLTANTYYTHSTVYMANVSESDLSSGFIHPDNDHVFVKVLDDVDLSFTEIGEQFIAFDSSFTWDGHSNVLFAVNRQHGSWTSSTSFQAHVATGSKMRYIYQDSGPYDITTVSDGYASSTVGDIHLIACGAGCNTPAVSVTSNDYQSATIAWSGSAEQYEVAVKAAGETSWPAATSVSNLYTYTFNALTPATQYTARVRAICDAENDAISDWGIVTFVTDSLPCFAPSNVEVDAQGQQAVVSWTAGGNETQWVVRVYNTTFDQEYTATTNPYTVTGLTANVTYNVTVSSLCGNGAVQSEWTEPVSFTTVPCDPVTNVQVTGITTTTANVSWTAGDNNTGTWKVDWNYHGASVGSSGSTTVNTTSTQLTGLTAGAEYDVSISAICAAGYESNYTTQSFTTTVGIASVEDGLNLSIYPNPATGNTTITLSGVNGNVTLSVIDMSGRTVKTTTMDCSGDCQQVIDVDNLAAGAYFVRVYGDNVNTVKKLIVK